ncbi:protein LKAAEAR1 isoform X2 [Pongo pygmaeus]|nr:protein LKAAEAR1 isoform X2 [Pongo abelii]XP_054323778.1 protein LKAAEAR1 isoform X2 [Pongo pygmaeus]
MAELLGTCARERERAWAKLRGWGCGTQNRLRRAQRAGAGAHGGALPRGGQGPVPAPAPTGRPPPSAGGRMPRPAKEGGRKGPRERSGKSAPGAARGEERAKGAPATEPPKPGWALTSQGLAAMLPAQRHRHLLFGDLLEDVGAAASTFPCGSVEPGYRMPDPRPWTQSLELPAERQNRLLGVLKAAEARGRVRALRLRYTRMRAEEIALLLQRQKSARAAIRLELFLPPQLKPTRIPDPLDRQERRRVETILEENVDGTIFPR